MAENKQVDTEINGEDFTKDVTADGPGSENGDAGAAGSTNGSSDNQSAASGQRDDDRYVHYPADTFFFCSFLFLQRATDDQVPPIDFLLLHSVYCLLCYVNAKLTSLVEFHWILRGSAGEV